MKPKSDTTKQPLEEGKKYHIDIEFDGSRLVDDVTTIESPSTIDETAILVYSPNLMANILVEQSELKTIEPDSKEGLHTQE